MNIVGLDIGGANLKLADLHQQALTLPFALWKSPEQLETQIRRALQQFPSAGQIALTMTGELADCFASKAEGVKFIAQSVLNAAGSVPVLVWQTAGEFVDPDTAIQFPELTAAANWHALATWAARATAPAGTGLLLDMGSTTVDILPLKDGHAIPRGQTDFTRLQSGELVYTGGRRTPLMAIASEIVLDGLPVPLAAEYFATTQDLYLLTGQIPEDPTNRDTADNRPADISHARQRLARMVCCDADDLSSSQFDQLLDQFITAQQQQIRNGIKKVLDHLHIIPEILILSGSALFVIEDLLQTIPELQLARQVSLQNQLGSSVASAACAYALAQLAMEQ